MRGIVAPRWGAISPMDTAIPQLRTPTARLQWPIIARPLTRPLSAFDLVSQIGGLGAPFIDGAPVRVHLRLRLRWTRLRVNRRASRASCFVEGLGAKF